MDDFELLKKFYNMHFSILAIPKEVIEKIKKMWG
jgi:hypothetical protein